MAPRFENQYIICPQPRVSVTRQSICHINVRLRMYKGTGKRGHIVADDVSWSAQTGKHLLRDVADTKCF